MLTNLSLYILQVPLCLAAVTKEPQTGCGASATDMYIFLLVLEVGESDQDGSKNFKKAVNENTHPGYLWEAETRASSLRLREVAALNVPWLLFPQFLYQLVTATFRVCAG